MIANLLDDPGEQDLTAHVDFGALQTAGEDAGLQTVEFTSQSRFLTAAFEEIVRSNASGFNWPPARSSSVPNPHLIPNTSAIGFKVLVQSRALHPRS